MVTSLDDGGRQCGLLEPQQRVSDFGPPPVAAPLETVAGGGPETGTSQSASSGLAYRSDVPVDQRALVFFHGRVGWILTPHPPVGAAGQYAIDRSGRCRSRRLGEASERKAPDRARQRPAVYRQGISGVNQAIQLGRNSHPRLSSRIERKHRTVPRRLRQEGLSDQELKHQLHAQDIIGRWVEHYNQERLHAALAYLTPQDWLLERQQARWQSGNRSWPPPKSTVIRKTSNGDNRRLSKIQLGALPQTPGIFRFGGTGSLRNRPLGGFSNQGMNRTPVTGRSGCFPRPSMVSCRVDLVFRRACSFTSIQKRIAAAHHCSGKEPGPHQDHSSASRVCR
jgi:hypothetical protein